MLQRSTAASTPSIRLSANDMAQLRAITAMVKLRQRSGRKALLFAGNNAAAAAEALARQLRRDLFRIDLAAVVSKFIGETEKNLAGVLAEAGTADTMLLFDEADALFGKRTGVKDAHDRFSNRELDDLLRTMTAHGGLAVFASKPRLALPLMLRGRFSVYEFPPRPAARMHRRASERGTGKPA
jgi:SpoVK/Ycf46/Vps4 family AAA+-type ATPase